MEVIGFRHSKSQFRTPDDQRDWLRLTAHSYLCISKFSITDFFNQINRRFFDIRSPLVRFKSKG